MADLLEYIGARLIGNATVTAIVPAARIWQGLRPQEVDTLPSVNYFQVDEAVRDQFMVGVHAVQISARAELLLAAQQLSEACGQALYSFEPTNAAGVDVQRVYWGGRVQLAEPDLAIFHVALTLRFAVLSTIV